MAAAVSIAESRPLRMTLKPKDPVGRLAGLTILRSGASGQTRQSGDP